MLTVLAYLLLAILAVVAVAVVLAPFGLLAWMRDRGHVERAAEADALLAEAEALNAEAQALQARSKTSRTNVLRGI